MCEEAGDRNRSVSESSDHSFDHDPHFSPIISLPEVVIVTNEEEEEVLLKLRAKLYRFDTKSETPEWKERGTGDVKMLKHFQNKTVRIVMRRDKTLKVCANHFITPFMELKPSVGSDKAFVYTVFGDFADEQIKSECLAIRFANVEFANQFKEKFNEAKKYVSENCKIYTEPLNSSSSESENEGESDGEKDEESKDETEIKTTIELTQKLSELEVTKNNEEK